MDLLMHFQSFGNVLSAKAVYDKQTGKSKGYGKSFLHLSNR